MTAPSSAGVSALRALANIINDSVDTIEALASKHSVDYPSPDGTFDPSNPSEIFARDPAVLQVTNLAISAASQLAATIKSPGTAIIGAIRTYHTPTALRIATATNTVEILREAGPKGLHVNDIAAKSGVDPNILGRVLRLLATHYIFREVEPDVFANNRLSSMIDTKKSSSDLFARPQDKFTGTNGIAAYIEHGTDEVFKASAYLAEAVLNPKEGLSAFQRAFSTDIPVWEWLETPENKTRLVRFGVAMEGGSKLEPQDAILRGFDWKSLHKGSVVVDVGGGIGSSTLVIAKANPELKFVVQDRSPVIEQAKSVWSADGDSKRMIESGQVTLQGHDFFNPQPVKNANIFMLRIILHAWDQDTATAILKHLHEVATPTTRLVIIDQVVAYACPTLDVAPDVRGASETPAPYPLLANFGEANATVYATDLHMCTMIGGQERTVGQFVQVTRAAGWELVAIHRVSGSVLPHLECKKI